jgi:hypothetical protein
MKQDTYNILIGISEKRNRLENLDVDGRVIIKLILNERRLHSGGSRQGSTTGSC